MNRPELDLCAAHVEVTEKLTAAKDAYRAKPGPATKAKLAAAKREAHELTAYWRGIRTFFHPDAIVPTVSAKTRSN